MKNRKRVLCGCVVGWFLVSSFTVSGKDIGQEHVYHEPIDGIRIAWDYSTLQFLAERGGYARMLRLADNSIAAVYEDWALHKEAGAYGNVVLIRSFDEGKTWSDPQVLFPYFYKTNPSNGKTTLVGMYNAEIYQLKNGDLLAGADYRPRTPEVTPFAIAVRKSTDNGKTWGDIKVLYGNEPRFGDGCWEPSFLELPSGEVQVYFANENNFIHSNEQEISVVSSFDGGDTWGKPRRVSFRAGHRDGMPVARVIGDEIVVVIEDNKTGNFRPYTVRTKLTGNWEQPVLADSPWREYCLVDSLDPDVIMGAPYLLKLPSGETLLSYQSTQGGRPSRVDSQIMQVTIGDKSARHFGRTTQPFPLSAGQQSMWNSIALWNAETVAAVGQVRLERVNRPAFILGHILSDIQVKGKKVDSFPIFVGAKTSANLKVGVGNSKSKLYIKCLVSDSVLVKAPSGTQKGDGVYLSIDNRNASLMQPGESTYKIWCSVTGECMLWKGEQKSWKRISSSGVKVKTNFLKGGYELCVTLSKKKMGINAEDIRLGAGFSNYTSMNDGTTEYMVHGDINASYTWIKVSL